MYAYIDEYLIAIKEFSLISLSLCVSEDPVWLEELISLTVQ